jgi:hypothetical protein
VKLYATTIQNIKLPTTGRIDISDDKTTGLKLRISASGHRSWSMTFKDSSGRAQRYGIGEFPGVSLELARKRANTARELIQQGINPIEKERREKIDREQGLYPTCVDAYLKNLERKAKPGYIRDVKALLNIPEWKNRTIKDIRRRDAIAVYEKTGARAPGQAVHQRIYFSGLWKYCLQREIVDVNIITGTEPYKKPTARTRVLDDLELASLWRSSYRLSQPFGACIQFLALSGLRKSNAAQLQDAQVGQSLQFEAGSMKGGRTFTPPISSGMRALLDAQPRHKDCAYYFTADGRRPVRGIEYELQKLRTLVAEDMGHPVTITVGEVTFDEQATRQWRDMQLRGESIADDVRTKNESLVGNIAGLLAINESPWNPIVTQYHFTVALGMWFSECVATRGTDSQRKKYAGFMAQLEAEAAHSQSVAGTPAPQSEWLDLDDPRLARH